MPQGSVFGILFYLLSFQSHSSEYFSDDDSQFSISSLDFSTKLQLMGQLTIPCLHQNVQQISRLEICKTIVIIFPPKPTPHIYPLLNFLKVFIYLFIYLAMPGLRCSLWDLELQHANSLAVACGIQFPEQGWNQGPQHCEGRVLVTGPPGKSLLCCISLQLLFSIYSGPIHKPF